jgi:hypothetical protein
MADRWTDIFKAREKLAQYSDTLWSGREAASGELRHVYTQRLAVAARLATQLWNFYSVDAVRQLLREEDRAFPRALLATDAGRAARGAFNLLVRAAAALEEHRPRTGAGSSSVEDIIGEDLSAVTFVRDYLQLNFDGPVLTVLCPLVVHWPEGIASSEQPGFRDALCGVIGETVRSVEVGTDIMVVTFDRHKLELPFGKSGWPEHLTFHDRDGRMHTFAKD